MKIGLEHKKEKCPRCGSKEILTIGWDQMCCACDWDNSRMLVNLGQLDNLSVAAAQQFGNCVGFETASKVEKQNDEVAKQILTDMPSRRIA
ncbi:MAG: hypothetical protein J0L82_18460 [Deltaproteobacteria bacterium]|nr:hypothetical protein [Deltaproteobacteria bacterium]